MKNIKLIIDFDSTFIKLEAIDVIAEAITKSKSNKNSFVKKIAKITSMAMVGKIPFDIALIKRIKLLNANKDHIQKTIREVKNNISDSVEQNKEFFIKNSENCYIVSGGFKEIILPTIKSFGIKKKNVFANTFIYNKNDYIKSIDTENPLSKDRGKVLALEGIKKEFSSDKKYIVIGDGYTDYQLKKHNIADVFIQFVENINRKSLNKKADFIARNFNEAIKIIETL